MTTAQTTGSESHATPGPLEMLISDISRSFMTPDQFRKELREYHVAADKDGHPDVTAIVRYISDHGKTYAAKNQTDPLQTTPTDREIGDIFKTEGAIEDGKFSEAAINQIFGLYTQNASSYASGRLQNGILRSAVKTGAHDSEVLANASGNFDSVKDIKSAKDQEGVLRAVGPALNDMLSKAQAAMSRGRLSEYIKGLKDYMSGQMTPQYSGAH
ncbi:MAG TPA: hypothetical protein VI564_07620 [Candidatus Nanoarchaeia archaeon]|nr:hypothetical protein [Candidatus Nanoarchaeia archaeon]